MKNISMNLQCKQRGKSEMPVLYVQRCVELIELVSDDGIGLSQHIFHSLAIFLLQLMAQFGQHVTCWIHSDHSAKFLNEYLVE